MTAQDLNHYASKTAITKSIVLGTHVRALCGETFVVESQGTHAIPGHEVASVDLPTCPACEMIHGALRDEAEARVPAGTLI